MHFLGRWHCLVQIPAEIVLIYLAELILDQVPIYWLEVVQKSKHHLLFLQLEPRNSLCNVAKLFNNSSFAKSCNNCRCSSAGMGREPTGSWSLGGERICMKGRECGTRTRVLPCWGEGSSGLLRLHKRCETWEASELVQSLLAPGFIQCCALPFAFKLTESWIGFGSSLWRSELWGWDTLNYWWVLAGALSSGEHFEYTLDSCAGLYFPWSLIPLKSFKPPCIPQFPATPLSGVQRQQRILQICWRQCWPEAQGGFAPGALLSSPSWLELFRPIQCHKDAALWPSINSLRESGK